MLIFLSKIYFSLPDVLKIPNPLVWQIPTICFDCDSCGSISRFISMLAVLAVMPEGSVVDVDVIDVSVVVFCCCFIACKICCADAVLDVVRFGTGGFSSSSSSSSMA